jgi:hypothetical protein
MNNHNCSIKSGNYMNHHELFSLHLECVKCAWYDGMTVWRLN